jgi:peptidoglycan/LPS O-acetylase OafA/YrhL
MGLAAVITIDGFAWGIAGELSANSFLGPRGGAEVLHDLQESEWAYAYYLTPLGFIVGMLLLAIGAARQGAVPTPAAAVLALAVLMVGTETVIVSNAYFIAGAAVFLVGGIAVALAILRMGDEQFAQGGA